MIQENSNITEKSISQNEKYGSTDLKVNIPTTIISRSDFYDVESGSYERKRKRIRRRKKKKIESPILLPSVIKPNNSTPSNCRSLKLTFDKPNVNHLKFCWDDSNEEQSHETINYSASSKPIVHSTEITNLGALLSLQSSQVPPSYSGKRQMKTSSDTSTIISSNSGSPVKMNNSNESLSNPPRIPSVDYSQINIDEYPIHNEAFEPGDIIAFQTLILNGNYCPTLSDYILAKILTIDILTNTYSCKILASDPVSTACKPKNCLSDKSVSRVWEPPPDRCPSCPSSTVPFFENVKIILKKTCRCKIEILIQRSLSIVNMKKIDRRLW
ncbi:hypothetical protein PV327_010121 [Microctonus hyperodae]|nr:hypothetical protein PV327_010121 [Microctonus hyperodae]